MKKNINAVFVAIVAFISSIHVFNIQKTDVLSDIALINVEALADNESSVTCKSDKGDVCIINSTSVPDYDEGCATWLWG